MPASSSRSASHAPISFTRWQSEERATLLTDLLLHRYAEHIEHEPALAGRLKRHVPDFWEPYAALYGSSYDMIEPVVHLFDLLMRGVENRPKELRTLDGAREAEPGWFQRQEIVGMMLYVDLFADDLRGVAEKIPYLQELGIRYVHLMPLLKPRQGPNDGGYAVEDYRSVDPRLGTMDDLRALARRLRDADILLVIDFVMNHTAREHAWARAAVNGDERYQHFYYMFDDRTLPEAYEQTLPEVFPDFAPGSFSYVSEIEKWVWTTFYDFQWDLNYANPEVFEHVFGEMLFLANVGVDVLRLDAVPFLWKQMGTNCQNLPGAHRLLRAYRALMRIAAPGVLFKSEAIVAPEEIIRYLGVGEYEGRECDIGYHAALMCHLWHALAAENTQLLRTMLVQLPPVPKRAAWLNYIRSHDDIGWGLSDENAAAVGQDGHQTRLFCTSFYTGELPPRYAEGYRFQVDAVTGEARVSGTSAALAGLQKAQVEGPDEQIDLALQRLLLLYNVIFSMKGLPLLYSGDEIGQLNDFSYLQDPLKAVDNRWVHRPRMNWAKAALRHEPGTVEHRLFRGIRQFVDARCRLKALHVAADEHILFAENDRLFVVERSWGNERLLVISNFSSRSQRLTLGALPAAWRLPVYRDVLGERTVHFFSSGIVLPPYGFWWLAPVDAPAEPGPPVSTPVRLFVETAWGEEVYITGSLDALGEGDPTLALGPLDPRAYPYWTAQIEVPEGVFFTFRWIKKRGRRIVAWSPQTYWMEAGRDRVYELES